MAFLTNWDLERDLGLSRATCYDLVAHRRIPFFPDMKGNDKRFKKSGAASAHHFNLYRESTVRQLTFLLSKMDGESNEQRAKNLLKWATDNYTSINKEEMDMFFAQSSMTALSQKLDAIIDTLGIDLPKTLAPIAPERSVVAPETPKTLKGWSDKDSWRDLAERNVGASTPIKASVIKALDTIMEGLHTLSTLGARGFKKSNVIDLVEAKHEVLSYRMRKHKDVVWEHTRKFLLEFGYVAQGASADTLVLGPMMQSAPQASTSDAQQAQ